MHEPILMIFSERKQPKKMVGLKMRLFPSERLSKIRKEMRSLLRYVSLYFCKLHFLNRNMYWVLIVLWRHILYNQQKNSFICTVVETAKHCQCMVLIFPSNQIAKDDGVRPGTTMEILAKLRPAFKEGGSTTAGQEIH